MTSANLTHEYSPSIEWLMRIAYEWGSAVKMQHGTRGKAMEKPMNESPESISEETEYASGVGFCGRGCLFALLGYCVGGAVGAALSVFIWSQIHPPYGPDYGEGIGWGMSAIGLMIIGSFIGGIIGAIIGLHYNAKMQQK